MFAIAGGKGGCGEITTLALSEALQSLSMQITIFRIYIDLPALLILVSIHCLKRTMSIRLIRTHCPARAGSDAARPS
jgi:hypothetical protein